MTEEVQKETCLRFGADFVSSPGDSKLGVALSTRGALPANGLRHPASGDTCGWFLWWGESYSDSHDFFVPLHVAHVYDDFPELTPLLGLPPGYRFLLAGEHLDVWFDLNLLDI